MNRHNKNGITILAALEQPLSAVLNHSRIKGLRRRLFSSNQLSGASPVHIAVHAFDGTRKGKLGTFVYTGLHAHKCWEIDLVIPEGPGFVFQIETPRGIEVIRRASTILIPPHVDHRMEIVRGRGKMVCIVFAREYDKSLLNPRSKVSGRPRIFK